MRCYSFCQTDATRRHTHPRPSCPGSSLAPEWPRRSLGLCRDTWGEWRSLNTEKQQELQEYILYKDLWRPGQHCLNVTLFGQCHWSCCYFCKMWKWIFITSWRNGSLIIRLTDEADLYLTFTLSFIVNFSLSLLCLVFRLQGCSRIAVSRLSYHLHLLITTVLNSTILVLLKTENLTCTVSTLLNTLWNYNKMFVQPKKNIVFIP